MNTLDDLRATVTLEVKRPLNHAMAIAITIPILLDQFETKSSLDNEFQVIGALIIFISIVGSYALSAAYAIMVKLSPSSSPAESENVVNLDFRISPEIVKDERPIIINLPPLVSSMSDEVFSSTEELSPNRDSTATPISRKSSLQLVKFNETEEKLWKTCTESLTEKETKWLDTDIKYRFIRGSAFIENPKKREAYLKKRLVDTCAFREKYRIDSILQRDFPFCKMFRDDCWRMKIYGNDSEGNPIVYVRMADHSYKNCKHAPYHETILEYLAYHQEALLRAVRRRSVKRRDIVQPQYTAIFDLGGFGWRDFKDAYECGFFSEVAELWAVNYPETIRRIFVINAPFIVTAFMKIVKPFIEPDTLEKLRIIGHNYAHEFENHPISISSLPIEVGGQCLGEFILPLENPKLDLTQ